MKKMLICFGVLCMTLLLFCGTALAAVEIKGDDASVTVTKDAAEKVFTVKKSGVTDGQLYLVMIQKGDASAKPTAENLYYLNVEKASGTTFTMDAYPKDLDNGDYVVYLSDYAGANGGRKQVATLSVTSGGGTGTGDNPGGSGGTGMKGDLDNDKKRNINDVMMLIKVVVNNEDATNLLEIADFDNDQKLTITDVMTLIRMVVNNE